MAFIVADRVMESSTTTGTGALALGGAYSGYRRFSAAMSTSDTCKYVIEAVDGNGNPSGDFEVGIGTYSALNTLTRTTVETSSNANAAVNFAAGTKRVMLDASAALLNSFLKNSNNLSDVSNTGTARTNLGVAIGSNVQAWDADLDALSTIGAASQGDIIYRDGSAWTRLAAGTNGQLLKTLGSGANPAWATTPGTLSSQFTSTGTAANNNEQTLLTYTLPANTVSTNGWGLKVEAAGTLAATTRTRTVKLVFGAGTPISIGSTSSGNIYWHIEALIVRRTSSTQIEKIKGSMGTSAEDTLFRTRTFALTEDLTTALDLKITGTVLGAAVANDIVCDMLHVRLLPL